MMNEIAKGRQGLHPDCYIELVIEDSYYNMHEQVIAHPHVVDIARQAMVDAAMTADEAAIAAAPTARSSHLWDCRCQTCLPVATTITANMRFVTLGNGESGAGDPLRIAELTAAHKGINRTQGGPVGRVSRTRCRMAASRLIPAYGGSAGERGTRRPGKRSAAGQDDSSSRQRTIAADDQRAHGEEEGSSSASPKWSARGVSDGWLRRPAPDGAGVVFSPLTNTSPSVRSLQAARRSGIALLQNIVNLIWLIRRLRRRDVELMTRLGDKLAEPLLKVLGWLIRPSIISRRRSSSVGKISAGWSRNNVPDRRSAGCPVRAGGHSRQAATGARGHSARDSRPIS